MKKPSDILTLFLLFIIPVFYYLNAEINIEVDIMVIITFALNLIVCNIEILREKYYFSLNKIFWFFNYYFLIVAPLMQYLNGTTLWHVSISNNEYIFTNSLVLLWFITYIITKRILTKKYNKKRNNDKNKSQNIIKPKEIQKHSTIDKYSLLITLISLIIFLIYIIIARGYNNLITIKTNFISTGSEDLDVVLNIFLKSICVMSLTYILYGYMNNKNKTRLVFLLIMFFIVISLCWVNNGRWFIGLVYIGLYVIIFKNKINKRTFDLLFIIVIGIVFPFFQLFKDYTLNEILNGGFEYKGIQLMISNNVDFDAYSIIPRTVKYVSENGLKPGLQILTSFLYFIPRKIWSWKSYPSGVLIGETNPAGTFTNLSCPLIAEGYFNFGIIGIIIFAVIFCKILFYFDNSYWEKNKQNKNIFIDYIYPYLLGLIFIINRGSLQFFINYTVAFYLPILILSLFKKRNRKV